MSVDNNNSKQFSVTINSELHLSTYCISLLQICFLHYNFELKSLPTDIDVNNLPASKSIL